MNVPPHGQTTLAGISASRETGESGDDPRRPHDHARGSDCPSDQSGRAGCRNPWRTRPPRRYSIPARLCIRPRVHLKSDNPRAPCGPSRKTAEWCLDSHHLILMAPQPLAADGLPLRPVLAKPESNHHDTCFRLTPWLAYASRERGACAWT